jgi:hypothetical protein
MHCGLGRGCEYQHIDRAINSRRGGAIASLYGTHVDWWILKDLNLYGMMVC